MGKWFILTFLLLTGQCNAVAQQADQSYDLLKGHPFIQNYSPKDYRGYSQNWMITQGPQGQIFVANNFGILEYDGANWRKIKTSFGHLVRVVVADSTGRILVGARKEFC